MSALLIAGLAVIAALSIIERLRERPHFDWSRMFNQAARFVETDLQVEGLARSGDVRQAIAMYQRLHQADYKKAQRAVMLLASGEREKAAAMGQAAPNLIPRLAAPRGYSNLGQFATALMALQAEAVKRRAQKR